MTITLPEAARRLGITRQRLWQLVKAGRLPARRLGRDWLIEEADLALLDGRGGRRYLTAVNGGR